MLTPYDLERDRRQLSCFPTGREGQERIRKAHIVIAGAGGLGSPAALYLTAAGIGRLTIIDDDHVSLTNLNRQILHYDGDLGAAKVSSAATKLGLLNPSVQIQPLKQRITEENAAALLDGAHVVIDGMDNFATRLILNQACVKLKIPFIHGGVHGLMGQVTTIIPGETPCFACLCREIPEQDKEIPVLGPLPGMIACIQVTEAIKYIAGFGELLANRMLFIDGTDMVFSTFDIERLQTCPVCGDQHR
ncbi:MAG: HesA/MoeB/ThiF family protein [Syntrophobacterales bacterium]|nr:HesA/MoeB/ThiF family protein [Syntrophobacterales bacterium]